MTIGLLLQYLISKLKALVKPLLHIINNVYDVYDMLCMFMKFAGP